MSTSKERLSRAMVLSVCSSVAFAAVKGVAGVAGQSYALIADAMESIMDTVQSLVVLGGVRLASTPPDEKHPYGHGKADPLAAIVVAFALLAAALGLAIQSIRQIYAPPTPPKAYTLFVLVLVIVGKELLYRFLTRRASEVESLAARADAWHHRSDAITSLAAFFGILAALIGGPRFSAADEWAALFVCVVIAYNGVRLLRPALAEVMDAAPAPDVVEKIRADARAVDGVKDIDTCLVRKMGYDLFVDIHVLVDGDLTVREGHRMAHVVKQILQERHSNIRDVLVHIEPHDIAQLKADNEGE